MTVVKKLALLAAVATCVTALPDSAAFAAGGGSMDMGQMNTRERTPQDQARDAYNQGVRQIKHADGYYEDAVKATDPAKAKKAQDKADTAYKKALEQFQTAVQSDSSMHQAWNYIGYAQRHLGKPEDALQAYEKALSLQPGYPEAIEYRGEAYLQLNRLNDARGAYMDLFSRNRKLADQLLGSMQKFVTERRAAPNGLTADELDSFSKWVDERATIASQTASLDTGVTGTSW